MILSPWKLTFDPGGTPIVLLDFGQRLAGDIAWASRRGSEVIPLLDSDAPFLRDGKNLSLQISYQVLAEKASVPDMLKGVMRGITGHQALGKKPLKIEAEGVVEAYWLAPAAMVPDLTGSLPANGTIGNFKSHAVIMAGLAEVATGIPPLADPVFTPEAPGEFPAAAFSPSDPGEPPTISP